MDAESGARRCAFCDEPGRKMSKEHVWSQWLLSLAPESLKEASHSYTYEDGEGWRRDVPDQAIFSMTVRSVCGACNSGWMNRIEEAARPYLTSILSGRSRDLHREGQARLARWGFLKALVAQLAFRDHATEQLRSDCRRLFALRDRETVPGDITVLAAPVHWVPPESPGLFRLNGIGLNDEAGNPRGDGWEDVDGYVQTFTVLGLAIFVLRLEGEGEPDFGMLGHGEELTRSMTRLWPTGAAVRWPAGSDLSREALARLAGGV